MFKRFTAGMALLLALALLTSTGASAWQGTPAIKPPDATATLNATDDVLNVVDPVGNKTTYVYRGGAATKIEMENGVRSGNDRWFLKTSINTREQTPCLQLHPNPPFLASTRMRSRECCLASIA